MTVVYEVNTFIEEAATDEFQGFLESHIQQMLEVKGFLSAELLCVERDDSTPSGTTPFCCTYKVICTSTSAK